MPLFTPLYANCCVEICVSACSSNLNKLTLLDDKILTILHKQKVHTSDTFTLFIIDFCLHHFMNTSWSYWFINACLIRNFCWKFFCGYFERSMSVHSHCSWSRLFSICLFVIVLDICSVKTSQLRNKIPDDISSVPSIYTPTLALPLRV